MKDLAPKPHITFAAWQTLMAYNWPGNVRQLKYVVKLLSQRCALTKQQVVTRHEAESLLPQVEQDSSEFAEVEPSFRRYQVNGDRYEDVKAHFLADYVYQQHQRLSEGRRTIEAYKNTARLLGCSLSTVKDRLRDYEVLFPATEGPTDEV